MLIETKTTIATQVLARELLYYANYLPNRNVDLDRAVKECRRKAPPPIGSAVDSNAFWNDLILGTPSCRKFIEKQRIDNLEELIHRFYTYNIRLETQELIEREELLHGDSSDRY